MCKKYYFTDITKAQYMAKHFGWEFEKESDYYRDTGRGDKYIEALDIVHDVITLQDLIYFDDKLYLMAQHHHHLGLKNKDFFLIYSKSFEQPQQIIKINYLQLMLNAEAKKIWLDNNKGEIIRRNNKAFFMPECVEV